MERQIDKCLISMRKIANLNDKSRIDTTRGDVDEYTEGLVNRINRIMNDSREKALRMLQTKFNDIKEMSRFIIESGKFVDRLDMIKHALEKSKEGLTLYKNNILYVDDAEIKSTVEHILEVEIPAHILMIDEYQAK
jgi:hypothetical protein